MNEPLLSSPQQPPHSSSIHQPHPSSQSQSSRATSLHDRASIHTTSSATTLRPSAPAPSTPPTPTTTTTSHQRRTPVSKVRHHGLYSSEAEYLSALREWAEEKKYTRLGEQGLVGFYGSKTMEECAAEEPPHFRFGRKARRAGTAVVAAEERGERGGAGGGRERGSSFYTHSPFEVLTAAKEYDVSDVVKKIKVPVFIGNGEFDTFATGQPTKLKQALGTLGTLHDFNGTAGYHSQTGATQEMVIAFFAWLNKTFPKQ
ncbi:MAG: hypothetical protein M1828_004258 [Chrysothrix sp. TS-e1954]|nr:MAG: hypothetical protein M1828_004258 [Chrysothrix sp. TS-e1954]